LKCFNSQPFGGRLDASSLKQSRLSNAEGNAIAINPEPSEGRGIKTDNADLEALVRLVTETIIAKIGSVK